jgi:adenine/guanine phosphoribosyltransferase-like PRPP-binding protein
LGREERNVLFYENNEKLIQNSRMMRVVTEYVSDFVKNVFNSKIDVILHPTHSVGSFLAQLVSAQLNLSPIVFPLPQHNYGGVLELTAGDYGYYHNIIKEFKTKHARDQIKCLIIDDSVLTGNSLFSMLGIAKRLGLDTGGILVLLSRLTPEISSAIAAMSIPFSYLYRLHMPILNDRQSPDTKLKLINEAVSNKAYSYFAQRRANTLQAEDSHFRLFTYDVEAEKPPAVEEGALSGIRGEFIETYRLRQIIHNLILHPDPQILSFDTRIAIAYNFLEQLVLEDAFWKLLEGLFTSSASSNSHCQSIVFIQKIIYILAFSKYILPYSVYEKYQDTCVEFVKQCIKNETWVELKDLVSDCIMSLGIILSEKLTQVGSIALSSVLSHALEDLSYGYQIESILEEGQTVRTSADQQEAARDIIGAFAWSLHYYISQKRQSLTDNDSAITFVEAIMASQLNTETNLILIDILESVVSESAELKEKLRVDEWPDENALLTMLTITPSENPLLRYLRVAPGYTCTLKILLRICKADTVLLYMRNDSDKEYILRVFDTRDNKRPDKDLKAAELSECHLPEALRERMKQSLFFSSSNQNHASALNDFSVGSEHLWCMGGAVNIRNADMRYYVILGYKKRFATRDLQSTAYYYWLKCEALLREILPSIHSRYIESATAWNVHIQSIRPVHPIKWDDPTRPPWVNARRQLISYAMTRVDIGELLRRAVRMSSESVYTLPAIQNEIEKECKRLHINITSTINQNPNLAEAALWQGLEQAPFIEFEANALTKEQKLTFCAVPMTLLKFIAYECFYNALSHFETRIHVTMAFRIYFDIESELEKIWIILTVVNDLHEEIEGFTLQPSQTGTLACETAAVAVGGQFHTSKDPQSGLWVATTTIPVFKIPNELRMQLYDLLK